jgi:fibronectin type 3 domain-containing protein
MAGCAATTSGGSNSNPGGNTPPGTTIPATPSGLQASPGNAQVSLAWAAGVTATSYNVKRSTTTGGPYTKISSPTATNFTDTGLTNGTAYFYVVSALNSAGESANSAQASATPANTAVDVTVTINPASTHPISPYNRRQCLHGRIRLGP